MPQINFRYILNELKAKVSVLSGTGAPGSSPIYAVENAPDGKTLYEQTDTYPSKLWFKNGSGTWLEVGSGGGGGGGNILPWDMTPPSAPPVACAYPFTMTNAQAISLGRDGVWPAVGQAATYTVEGGFETQNALLTGSDLDAVQTFDTTTGTKAVRFRLVAPAISSIGGVGASVSASISGAGLSGGLQLALLCSGTTRTGIVTVEGSTVFNSTGAPETNEFFAAFDSTTSTIYLYLGDTLFYSGAYTPRSDARIFLQAIEYAGLSAPDIGKQYTLEVFTAAADIMAAPAVPAFPPGTTDICDNPLSGSSGGDAELPSGAVAGSLLEVEVAGTYATISYSVGDVAVVLTDGTTVQKLAPSPDEVQQYADLAAFPATGEAATLYIAADTGLVYRWDGSAYLAVVGGSGGASKRQFNILYLKV